MRAEVIAMRWGSCEEVGPSHVARPQRHLAWATADALHWTKRHTCNTVQHASSGASETHSSMRGQAGSMHAVKPPGDNS
jgi:hypothetical protein